MLNILQRLGELYKGEMMNNININVIDNFFNEDLQKSIWKSLAKPRWSFTGGNFHNPFWHIDDHHKEEFFNSHLKKIIIQKINLPVDVECIRIYANGQTAGQEGTAHIDDGHFTFLYFANLEWEITWQGHLMFLNKMGMEYEEENGRKTEKWDKWKYTYNEKEDEVSKIVTYKPNRAVIFPSNILHYADAPHRLYNGLRVSLAYKFKKI